MVLSERYQQSPSIVAREIVGEMILVPIRQNAGNLESIYTLNTTAARAWNLLDGNRTLAEISALIAEEFEVTPEQAAIDLHELATQLVSIEAILPVD
jgi:hypothetical protein